MKKYYKTIGILALILLGAFSMYKLSNKYSLNILKNNMECTIVVKGCEEAKAVSVDDEDNIYIAFNNYIKAIDKEGKQKIVLKNKDMNIEDMLYCNNSLIYISNDKVCRFSMEDESDEILCSNIPLSGNDIKRRLLLKDNIIYIAVGAMTNSGISSDDNKDLPSISITLNGVNYGEEPTGVFEKYGTRTGEGEKVKAEAIGNAAIYSLNLKNKKVSLYASGIRGVKGIDYNSKGDIEAIFSGMNDNGLRPVFRDKDYIYKLQKGVWYGWPDYSGGDPIDSPRFKYDKDIKPLFKNYMNKTVPAPLFQSDVINSLKGMAIDRSGDILEKDTVVFWDKSKEKICSLSAQNVYKEIIKLRSNSNIENIICKNNNFLVLDNKIGCVYSIHKKTGALGFRVPIVIIFFIFILAVSLLSITLYKLLKNKKN